MSPAIPVGNLGLSRNYSEIRSRKFLASRSVLVSTRAGCCVGARRPLDKAQHKNGEGAWR